MVYFRRFYVRRSYTAPENDPLLMIPTCLYVASKMEECPVRASVIVLCTGELGLQRGGYPYVGDHVLANEFRLLEGLQFYLVVFHPYTELPALVRDAGLQDLLDEAWSAVNDSYGTDLLLLHPPHVVALGCILLVACMHGREQPLIDWFSGLDVDLKEVGDASAVLLDMYTLWSETGSSTFEQLRAKFWGTS
jgi:cyclin-C